MTRTVVDADLLVFYPGNTGTTASAADVQVPNTDIERLESDERIQESKDSATFTLADRDDTYSSNIEIGDRIILRRQLKGESSLSNCWTGLVKSRKFTVQGPVEKTLELKLDDFVFGILSRRFVTNAFEGRQLAGTSSSIVNTIVSNNAPEIGLSQVDSIASTRTVEFQRTNLLEALNRLIKQSPVVMSSDGQDLVFEDRGALNSQFSWGPNDRKGSWTHKLDDRELVNDVIVDGVRDTALDVQQTSYDSFETVTDTNRRTQQVDVRKGEIAAVELQIDEDPNSSDNLVVRIQADDGSGNPREPGDRTADLARTILPPGEFSDGWVRFDLPENNLPDPNPHILVEADSGTGHGVGYESSTGETAYKVYYYYPTTTGSTSEASIDDYRRHEGRYRRENVRGVEEGKDLASTIVSKHRNPVGQLTFTPASTRAHNLSAGEVVDVAESAVGATGEFVVTSKSDTYSAHRLTSSITLKTKESV